MDLSKYKLIIFDCDGTLVDSESLINRAFSNVMSKFGYDEFTFEYCLENFSGMAYPNVVQKILSVHPNVPFREVEELFIEEANRIMPAELKAIKGAHELLEGLGNMPKCVASNGEREVVKYSLQITELDHFFKAGEIFTYEDVTEGKPSPELFHYAASKMGFEAVDCLVFEDSIIGLTAAKAAGMDAVAVHAEAAGEHKFNLLEEIKRLEPVKIITNLAEAL